MGKENFYTLVEIDNRGNVEGCTYTPQTLGNLVERVINYRKDAFTDELMIIYPNSNVVEYVSKDIDFICIAEYRFESGPHKNFINLYFYKGETGTLEAIKNNISSHGLYRMMLIDANTSKVICSIGDWQE